MIGTYAAALAVCGASLAVGQATVALCGVRRWSWLAPAVGLALICAICWATVRLPGGGATSAAVLLILTIATVAFLWGRAEGGGEALRAGLPVALPALAVASLPFLVEGHFGILGTGFNPDMSQHLLAADRLADGTGSQLLGQGYPLGPHAVAVALSDGLGIGLVQAFSGLTLAVVVLAPLPALAAFADQPAARRTAAALLVGLPYLVASYYAQGSFKETIQALFLLAFVLALRESSRNLAWHELPLRFVPVAVIAIGSVYVYSFPGLTWLVGTAITWTVAESAWARTHSASPAGLRALSLALIVFAVGALPELGRMIDFQRFETFDPSGPGLGNLFGQLSPFEALGIWPSGDFRLAPGDGAAPGAVYYLGAAFATALLLYGLARCWRRRESAILAGLVAASGVYAATRVGGTPYTAAKALEVAAPLATLAILLPLLDRSLFASPRRFRGTGIASPHDAELPRLRGTALATAAGYLLVAGGSSLLAFANAPVGPTDYSPALTGLRPLLATGSTLVLAPDRLLDEEHGARYIVWELRGGRVCIEAESASGGAPPAGVRFVVTSGTAGRPPFDRLTLRRRAGPYAVWERRGVLGGPSPCPPIAVRQGPSAIE